MKFVIVFKGREIIVTFTRSISIVIFFNYTRRDPALNVE